jgi:hypothetical protein
MKYTDADAIYYSFRTAALSAYQYKPSKNFLLIGSVWHMTVINAFTASAPETLGRIKLHGNNMRSSYKVLASRRFGTEMSGSDEIAYHPDTVLFGVSWPSYRTAMQD